MAALTGKTVANTYKDLLQVSNSNSGIDATLRPISDGEGTESKLQLSSSVTAVDGGLVIGSSYAGVETSPTDGVLIEGNVGIGTTTPNGLVDLRVGAANTLNDTLRFGQGANATTQTQGIIQQASNGDNWGFYKMGFLTGGLEMDTSGGLTYTGNDTSNDIGSGIIFDNINANMFVVGQRQTYTGTTRTLDSLTVFRLDLNNDRVGIGIGTTTRPAASRIKCGQSYEIQDVTPPEVKAFFLHQCVISPDGCDFFIQRLVDKFHVL